MRNDHAGRPTPGKRVVVALAATPGAAIAQGEGELDFESRPGLVERADPPERPDRIPPSTASGISALLSLALLCACIAGTRLLRRKGPGTRGAPGVTGASRGIHPSWHALSLLVSSFLGLNVAFGGLTAFLLNGVPEDARSYFAEISPLKLARLSHEHFFGYALLFGTMGGLALFFAGPRGRVLFPLFLTFAFAALDSASWWLSRYVSSGFHTLSFITGVTFAAGFLALYVQVAVLNVRAIVRRDPSASKE